MTMYKCEGVGISAHRVIKLYAAIKPIPIQTNKEPSGRITFDYRLIDFNSTLLVNAETILTERKVMPPFYNEYKHPKNIRDRAKEAKQNFRQIVQAIKLIAKDCRYNIMPSNGKVIIEYWRN